METCVTCGAAPSKHIKSIWQWHRNHNLVCIRNKQVFISTDEPSKLFTLFEYDL